MNNVLYHLHPVKVKRHGVRLSYTLCLGGLSFFLFILLTITGHLSHVLLHADWRTGLLRHRGSVYVRGLWLADAQHASLGSALHGALTVFLHMSRVFYHGAYKPPREFNWVVGVILLLLTLLLSFSGYLLPWDQFALWAVTVGTNMAGFVPGDG